MNNFLIRVNHPNNAIIAFINGSINEMNDNPRHVYTETAYSIPRNKIEYNPRPNDQFIYLLSESCNFNVFEYIPRLFTITTKNSSAQFNTEFLVDSSKTISNLLKEHPQELKYHINTKDEENVLSKFEQLYQGKPVVFEEDDMPFVRKVVKELHIINCPRFMKPKAMQNIKSYFVDRYKIPYNTRYGDEPDFSVKISQICLTEYLQKESLQTFTIQTKKNEYKCNIYGIFSSSKICEFLAKNPNSDRYVYDFDDEEGDFKLICDVFNFQKIKLTKDNSLLLKEISIDLGIEYVLDSIEKFIVDSEKVSQTIDDQQNIINTIDELFDLLYNIREKTVGFVAKTIKESRWIQTDENVIELAAFIFQVVQTKIQLQSYLIDLIIELKDLCNLVPFIVKSSMILFSENIIKKSENLIIPFVYKLNKKGLIPKDELKNELEKCFIKNSFFVSWFLPELIEYNLNMKSFDFLEDKIQYSHYTDATHIRNPGDIVFLYYPCNSNNMEAYKQMRDKGEYEDLIATSLRNDDVDTFQSIVSKSGENILKEKVRKNMFEPFFDSPMRYLNYAAAYGSIKCFKYLILNHEEIDNLTLKMAIIGGNNELIRIVSNNEENTNKEVNNNSQFATRAIRMKNGFNKRLLTTRFTEILTQAISIHRNDLFDWILEQKFELINSSETLFSLVVCSINNYNAHTLVQLIDNGFDFQNYSENYSLFLESASERGYYLLDHLLLNLINKDIKHEISISPKSAVSFGNILIFKYFDKKMNQKDLEMALLTSIRNSSDSIIKYFFEDLTNNKFKLNKQNSINFLAQSIQSNSDELLNYIIVKINDIIPFDKFGIKSIYKLLDEAIRAKNVEISIKFIKIIYQKNSNNNFTLALIQAAKKGLIEIVQFIIDNKCRIKYDDLTNYLFEIGSFDVDIFSLLMKIVSSENKKKMLNSINSAILRKNKPLVKFLLNENALTDYSLIRAVCSGDLELVEMILEKNHSSSFINRCFKEGTALQISVEKNYFDIFKKLISIPEINPSIYNRYFSTPLIASIQQLNVEMFKMIVDFYGKDKIKQQKWQLEKALSLIIDKISNKNNKNKYEHDDYDDDNDDYYDDDENNYGKEIPTKEEIQKITEIFSIIINLNCIDINHHFEENTMLTYAIKINSLEIIKILLQCDSIDVNSYSPNDGDTPLILAIKNHQFSIYDFIVQYPKTNINQANYENKTPLILAIEIGERDLAYQLITNDKFDPVESNINFAFLIADYTIASKLLDFKCLDVNYVVYGNAYEPVSESEIKISRRICLEQNITRYNENYIYTPQLIQAVQNGNKDLIEKIVKHPLFDRSHSQFFAAIRMSLFAHHLETLKILLQTEENLNICCTLINNNSIAIDAITEKSKEKVVSSIVHFPKYDADCSYIDVEISQNGLSMVKSISSNSLDFETFIYLLLNNGVDPNKPNENGFYPLEEAIINKCDTISFCLLRSNKIDFNQRIPIRNGENKFTSYLHLAIYFDRTKLASDIVTNNLCDVNITNDFGETPLMEACRKKNVDIIKMLSEVENVDYLHKNSLGEDAMQIALNVMKKGCDSDSKTENDVDTKEKYFAKLIIILMNSKIKSARGFSIQNPPG